MSREVDERVVAMYFDNKDFEKNAQSTIKTLEELRNGLDLEGSAKGLETIQKAGKSLNFDRANQSVRTFKNTLNGLGDVVRKAFNFTTAPLQGLENALNAFQGYVGKVIGFDLASKLVSTIESAIRQVTIEPITAGWNEYELKMDSIKTIMSGSGESLEVVKDKLEELNRYADKTIYSFSDMTSNIGKFTNNGVKLDDATAAIKGVANAAADAGQGAQQASAAMYNISQALGVGSMKLVDWKSIENANMATTKLKDTFLKLGSAMGELKQYTDKEGNIHYFAKDVKKVSEQSVAKMTKAELEAYLTKNKLEEITVENFRESLNKDWLTKEVMLNTFKVYSGDDLDIDIIQSWGFTEEEARELMKIGEEASKAATEVRTFTKMWDALKEAAQSGWAQSIEFIFGDMEEGTRLWTQMNDLIGGILNASAENRNNVLMAWRGMERQEDGTIRAIEGATDGREALIGGVMNIIGIFQDLGLTFSKASTAVFGNLSGQKLQRMTAQFQDFTGKIRQWLGVVVTSDTRLGKIRKGLQGVFSVIQTGMNFIKIAVNLVKRLAGPALDVLINLFERFGLFFDGMGRMNPSQVFGKIADGLGRVWTKLKSLFTVGANGTAPISTYLSSLWTDLKKVIRDWAEENGLGEALDAVKGVWDTIAGWDGWSKISGAFTSAKEGIETAWNTVSTWEGWAKIGRFFTDIWGFIMETVSGSAGGPKEPARKLTEASEETAHAIKEMNGVTTSGESGFIIWLQNLYSDLGEAWDKIIGWEGWTQISEFVNNVGGWFSKQFGTVLNWVGQPTEDGKTGFIHWLEGIRGKLTMAWNRIYNWPFWAKLGSFFGSIRDFIVEKGGAAFEWMTKPTDDGHTGFTSWLGDVRLKISEGWNRISNWPFWGKIGKFFGDVMSFIGEKAGGVVDWLTKPNEDGETGFTLWIQDVKKKIEEVWGTIRGLQIWDDIGHFISDTLNWITGRKGANKDKGRVSKKAETKNEMEENPVVSYLNSVWESIKSIWEEISVAGASVWGEISQFVNDIWGWMSGLFHAGEATQETEKVAEAMPEEKSVSLLERVLGKLTEFWNTITGFVDNITLDPTLNQVWETVGKTFEIIGSVITKIVDSLHGWIVEGNVFSAFPIAFWSGIFGLIYFAINKMKSKNLGNLATIAENSQSVGLQILEIAGAIALIAGAVAGLSMIDEGAAWSAIGKIAVIAVLLGALAAAAHKFRNVTESQDKPITGWERIAQSIVKYAGIMGIVWVTMKELPAVITAISNVSQAGIGQDVLSTLIGTMTFIGGVMLALAMVQKIAPTGIDPIATVKTVISVLEAVGITLGAFMAAGGIFELIDGLVDKLAGNDVDSIGAATGAIEKVGDVLNALGIAISGFLMGLFGIKTDNNKQRDVTDQLEWLMSISEQMDVAKFAKLSSLMNLIERISTVKINVDNANLIGDFMPSMGENLALFAKNLEDITTGDNAGERIQHLLSMVNVLGQFANAMSAVSDAFYILNYVTGLNFNSLNDEDSLGSLFELYTAAAEKLAEAIQKGLGENGNLSFNAQPIIDSIIVALGLGEQAIAQAVHDMVQQGINYANLEGGYDVPKTNPSNTDSFVSALQGLDGYAFDFSGLEESLNGEGGLASILSTFENDIPDMQTLFADKGWNMRDENGNPIDITSELTSQLGTLQDSLQALPAFEITITPVFDMSNLTPESIRGMLSSKGYPVSFGTTRLTADLDGGAILGEVRGMNSRLDGLTARLSLEEIQTRVAINNMSTHIDGIATAISKIQFVLDTNVLVGGLSSGIDYDLGNRAAISGRTGVTPKWSNIPTVGYDIGE